MTPLPRPRRRKRTANTVVVLRLPPQALQRFDPPRHYKVTLRLSPANLRQIRPLELLGASEDSDESLAELFSPVSEGKDDEVDSRLLERELDEVLNGDDIEVTEVSAVSGAAEIKEVEEVEEVSSASAPAALTATTSAAASASAPYHDVPAPMRGYFNDEMPPPDDLVATTVASLVDSYSGTRLQYPVKSTRCIHFECFDLEWFCATHRMPFFYGPLMGELRRLSDKRRAGLVAGSIAHYLPTQNALNLDRAILVRTRHATFRCPICDLSFTASQLYKSESMAYILSHTPTTVKRVELPDSGRFRAVDDSAQARAVSASAEASVVVIESDDDDDAAVSAPAPALAPKAPLAINSSASAPAPARARNSFTEKYIEFYFAPFDRPPQATGTADDPVTID
ncbi:hypothetical protein DIURU_003706 [Diutina rugosa]|uniref:SP-RING-type domain-containing protein n=1 Tax=Diutina rugosa TaxID=5481 RepID=A0A642UPB5_DIURU|nr:uncharacterized protein DIURU_003706 [Diutina rugosa]KAA8900594.1 hypothetical protein DIURU_003706 [Diutina rugosa]